jgi:SulP family sulfate permease
MTAIDATGLQALENLADIVHSSGRGLILCGAREQPARAMHQAEFEQHVGAKNVCPHVAAALHRARILHADMEENGAAVLSSQQHAAFSEN